MCKCINVKERIKYIIYTKFGLPEMCEITEN